MKMYEFRLRFHWSQVIIRTNAGVLLIWPLGINFSQIFIDIYIYSVKKMHLKTLSGKCQTFCLSLNVTTNGTSQPKNYVKYKYNLMTSQRLQDIKS